MLRMWRSEQSALEGRRFRTCASNRAETKSPTLALGCATTIFVNSTSERSRQQQERTNRYDYWNCLDGQLKMIKSNAIYSVEVEQLLLLFEED